MNNANIVKFRGKSTTFANNDESLTNSGLQLVDMLINMAGLI